MKLVYSDQYDLNLGDHVFPSVKYKLTKEKLLREGVVRPEDLVEPSPASDEDVALVHHREYIRKLQTGKLSHLEILRLEIPYSPELIRAVWLCAGGSILAARLAIRRLQKDGAIERAMTVDCDVHQGNGTAEIFAADRTVFTLSIHQERNYPYPKPPSNLDINLEDGAEDEEYLAALDQGLDQSLGEFHPDAIFYLAGADPYRDDQLGGLKLSLDGLERRDRMIYGKARAKNIPVMVTLAGGYARRLEDTIQIHANTIRAAQEFAEKPVRREA